MIFGKVSHNPATLQYHDLANYRPNPKNEKKNLKNF